jgi:hypothetical protein
LSEAFVPDSFLQPRNPVAVPFIVDPAAYSFLSALGKPVILFSR